MYKSNIGILTIPTGNSGIQPLSNLIKILKPLANEIYLITGNEGYTFFKKDSSISVSGIMRESGTNPLTRVLKYILMQLQMSYKLISLGNNVNIWLFFFGGDGLILPMLTAKILGKKVILSFPSSSVQILKSSNDTFKREIAVLSNINCRMADIITIYSTNNIQEWGLEKYRNKIMVAHEHLIDFKKFKISKPYDKREMIIGYIGRFYEEKGVMNFVKAIPSILSEIPDLKFYIIGDGNLRKEIISYVHDADLNDNVNIMDWIPHDELPAYLNDLKLLVLPSYTEGLPNIILEAMSCGTPVLATPVGAIQDVVIDQTTGFILKNNKQESIKDGVISTIHHEDILRVIENSKGFIEKEFTYTSALRTYSYIFSKL